MTRVNGSFVLDTNIVIALLAGDAAVVERMAQAALVFLPSIVVGELFYGAYRSGRTEANIALLDQLVSSRAVLPCDAVTARHYGWLKHRLRVQGRPIPENDLWIAALARQHGLSLVSRDAHLIGIESLSVEQW